MSHNFVNIPKHIRHCPTCDADTNQDRAIDGMYWICFTCGTKISDIEQVIKPRDEIVKYARASTGISFAEVMYDD